MPKHPPLHSPLHRPIVCRRQRYSQHSPRISRIYYSVIPQPGCSKIAIRLALYLSFQTDPSSRQLFLVHRLHGLDQRLALDDIHHPRKLLRAHHSDPVIPPRKQESRPPIPGATTGLTTSVPSTHHLLDGGPP